MKNITLTALIAAAIVVPIIMKMKKDKKLIPIQTNENIRYDINDYMESQGL